MSISDRVNRLTVLHVIRSMGLFGLLEHLMEHNPGKNNLYHNNDHLLTVAGWCAKLYLAEVPFEEYHHKTMKLLVCAALLHDYGHSGGVLVDKDNLAIVYRFIDDCHVHSYSSWGRFVVANADELKRIISITEFPYVREPYTLEERIIRDADILGSFTDNPYAVIVEGLYGEFADVGRTFTDDEILAQQETFLKGMEFFTALGKQIRDELVDEVVSNIREVMVEKTRVRMSDNNG